MAPSFETWRALTNRLTIRAFSTWKSRKDVLKEREREGERENNISGQRRRSNGPKKRAEHFGTHEAHRLSWT